MHGQFPFILPCAKRGWWFSLVSPPPSIIFMDKTKTGEFYASTPFNPFIPTSKRFINLTGRRFSRLIVFSLYGRSQSQQTLWFCRCVCRRWCVVSGSRLSSGHTKSCGCLNKEATTARNRTHGESVRGGVSPEYRVYTRARWRCNSPKAPHYADYGGRGIRFHFGSFDAFLTEMGRRPSPKHSLDRIDNNGHYEAGNVRWATQTEQCNNKRNNRPVTWRGKTLTVAEWGRESGIHGYTICDRLDTQKWCVECALTVKSQKGTCNHKQKR